MMRSAIFKLIWGCIFVCLFACEKSPESNVAPGDDDDDSSGDDDDDNGGDDDDDDSSGDDDDDDSGDDTDSDSACEEQEIDIKRKTSRLMILQDVSGSMIYNQDGTLQEPPTKWDQAEGAMISVLENFAKDVDFGLDSFPNSDPEDFCKTSDPVMADGAPDNAQKIIDKLKEIEPYGGTPLYIAMKRFTEPDYAEYFTSRDEESYLLVVSDGSDTCDKDGVYDQNGGASADDLADITKELLKDEIKTIVIGFGDDADEEQLNAIAAAGGTPFDRYLKADDQAELEAKIREVVTALVSCEYEIDPITNPYVDENKVNWYFDGKVVPYDVDCGHDQGWTWGNDDKTIVIFCEEACDRLNTEDIRKITVEFGCDSITPE